MRALSKFVRLSPSERRLVFTSAVLVCGTRIGLAMLPFERLRRLLGNLSKPGERRHSEALPDETLAWSVAAVSRYVPKATCLTQALALQTLLARQGRSSDLRIGVAKDEGQLAAHAWLERDGRILIGETESAHFTPLARPAPSSLTRPNL